MKLTFDLDIPEGHSYMDGSKSVYLSRKQGHPSIFLAQNRLYDYVLVPLS